MVKEGVVGSFRTGLQPPKQLLGNHIDRHARSYISGQVSTHTIGQDGDTVLRDQSDAIFVALAQHTFVASARHLQLEA